MASETKDGVEPTMDPSVYDDLPDLETKEEVAAAAATSTKLAIAEDEAFDSSKVVAAAADGAGAGEGDGEDDGIHYAFVAIEKEFSCVKDRELREKFKQWNVDELSRLAAFRFDRRFDDAQTDAFLSDLFNSAAVRAAFVPVGARRAPAPITGKVTGVKYERLSVKQLSMDFFDKVAEEGLVVPESGSIKKRYDEEFEGVTVGDDLREMLLNPDSEHCDLFDDAEKNELLYHVFRRLVVGGSMCQFEDDWRPYLDATKTMYKELVSARRTATGAIAIGSTALAVTGWEGETALWPKDVDHNWCYVLIDPSKRNVIIWYGAWLPWW